MVPIDQEKKISEKNIDNIDESINRGETVTQKTTVKDIISPLKDEEIIETDEPTSEIISKTDELEHGKDVEDQEAFHNDEQDANIGIDESETTRKETEPIVKENQESLYDQLKALADEIENGSSPLFRKESVIIPREKSLDLIANLLDYCEEGGIRMDDFLIDRLASDSHRGDSDYMPLRRVKQRAEVILGNASVQAETIVKDARILASKLLHETEVKIKARYDEVESDINERINSSKDATTKQLLEARDEVTTSRQQAVDILNTYMEKAEEDYQGYWERAEQTLQAAFQKADTILEKAADIYQRELDVLKEDLATIDGILEELRLNRPR